MAVLVVYDVFFLKMYQTLKNKIRFLNIKILDESSFASLLLCALTFNYYLFAGFAGFTFIFSVPPAHNVFIICIPVALYRLQSNLNLRSFCSFSPHSCHCTGHHYYLPSTDAETAQSKQVICLGSNSW